MSNIDRTISVAPMMDCTDRHDRYFLRLISKHVLLYTEMVATGAALKGDRQKVLGFNNFEKPLALQVGGSNKKDLAEVAKIADSNSADFKTLYDNKMSLWDKTQYIAQNIYGAAEIIADKKIRNQFQKLEDDGFGEYPICMAKTQYSFSTDPLLMGAPSGHDAPIKEVRLSAGAEFVVVVCGEVMTMPGLPRIPASENIDVDDNGLIQGLF